MNELPTSAKTPPAKSSSRDDASAQARERLQLLFSVALRNSVASLDGFSRRLGAKFDDAAIQAASPETQIALHEAVGLLAKERQTLQRLFSDCLQSAFEEEANALFAKQRTRLRNGAIDITLNTFEAMSRKVALENLAQQYQRNHAPLLALLDARTMNWLGLTMDGMRMPFRAEIFLQAALEAWRRFHAEPASERIFFTQLEPESFLPLEAIWTSLDAELTARQVPADENILSRYQRAKDGNNMLSLLQVEHRLQGRGPEALERTLIYCREAALLPRRIHRLLSHLQPALMQLAQVDTRFLVNPKHPARRLLQLTIHAALAATSLREDENGTERSFDELISRLGTELMRSRTTATLDNAAKCIEQFLNVRLNALAAKRDACILQAQQQERDDASMRQARMEIMSRLEGGRVPEFVEQFLLQQWVRVLTYARSVQATKPALLPSLVMAMDKLIASVVAIDAPRELEVAQLAVREKDNAALHSVLDSWLNALKWNGPAREQFFAQLQARHAEVVQATLSPRSHARLQENLNTIQRASDHDMRRRAGQAQEDALMPFMHRVDGLETGDWVEMVRNDGTPVQCRVSWVSPTRERFVLVSPSLNTALVARNQLLAEGLRAGRTRITADGEVLHPYFTHAVEALPAR